MTTENVNIIVTDDGTVKVQRNLEGIGTSAQKGQSGVDMLNKSLSRTKSGATNFNVGNIAAQFQDIGVTAAMMQNPLQIALQQGTQLSAVFASTGGGLGAVLKQLGAAFAQVFSPISILTIGLVALVAAGLQMVNWAKVAATTLIPLINYLQQFLAYLQQSPAILIAVGAAFLVAFGPPALAAVTALTIAIGNTLRAAIMSVFTLILTNPVTAVITAIAAGIGYVITQTIGWQAAIQKIIEIWGGVIQVIGVITDYFGLTTGLSNMGQEIINGASTAAANIYANLKGGGDYIFKTLKDGLNSGKEALRAGVDAGAASGAQKLKAGVEAGAQTAAQILKAQQEGAIHNYEAMNGVAVKQIGNALVDGGKFFYNQATGELTKAGTAAGQAGGAEMSKSIQAGGQNAGQTMQSSIERGGQGAARSISGEMGGFIQAIALYSHNISDLANAIHGYIAVIDSEAAKNTAEANLANAQAFDLRNKSRFNRNNNNDNSDWSPTITGGGNGSTGTGSGGSVGSSSGVPTPTASSTAASASSKVNHSLTGGSSGTSTVSVGIQNIIDPSSQLAAMSTQQGLSTIKNVIATNREDFQKLLGIV